MVQVSVSTFHDINAVSFCCQHGFQFYDYSCCLTHPAPSTVNIISSYPAVPTHGAHNFSSIWKIQSNLLHFYEIISRYIFKDDVPFTPGCRFLVPFSKTRGCVYRPCVHWAEHLIDPCSSYLLSRKS